MNTQFIIVLIAALGMGVAIWYFKFRKAVGQNTQANTSGMPPLVPNVVNPNRPNSADLAYKVCGYGVTAGAASQGVPIPPQAGEVVCRLGEKAAEGIYDAGKSVVKEIGSWF